MKRTLAALIAAVIIAAGLAACRPVPCCEEPPIDISIGVGFVEGAPAPTLTTSMRELFEEAVWSNGYYTVYTGDGEPRQFDHNILGSESDQPVIVQREQEEMIEAIDGLLLRAVPKVSQANPLGTLAAAARSFERPDRERRILMIGSGISTVAPLDMSIGENLYLDAQVLAEDLAARNLLPDLDGITVYWSGLGDTLGQPMTAEGRYQLIAIWTAIVEIAGGTLVVLESPLPTIDPGSFVDPLPPVNEVYVRPVLTPEGPLSLGEDSILFVSDLGVYVDKPKAEAILRALAPQIIQQGLVVTITGTTARQRSEAEQIRVGLLRAEQVKATLVGFGVPENLLEVASVGSYWACWHDESPGGTYSEVVAATNRTIVLTLPGQAIDELCR